MLPVLRRPSASAGSTKPGRGVRDVPSPVDSLEPHDLRACRRRAGIIRNTDGPTVARWETGQRRIPALAVRLLACLGRERQRRGKPEK